MKKLLLILALASAAWGTVRTITTSDSTTVYGAISAASSGDTIFINADTLICKTTRAQWNYPQRAWMYIEDKSLFIRGKGVGNTVLIDSTLDSTFDNLISIDIDSGYSISITGLTFKNTRTKQNDVIAFSSGNGKMVQNCRIYNCRFLGLGNSAAGIRFTRIAGVVDHCNFSELTGASNYAHSITYVGDSLAWFDSLRLNTEKNKLYIEKCILDNSATTAAPSNRVFDNGIGGKVVLRYSSVINGDFGSHGFDTDPWSSLFMEMYNNVFSFTADHYVTVPIRGGSAVFFNNTVTHGDGITIGYGSLYDYCACVASCGGNCVYLTSCPDTVYPGAQQAGRGPAIGATPSRENPNPFFALQPIYAWNNTLPADAGGKFWDVATYCTQDSGIMIKENRDFYNGSSLSGYVPSSYPHTAAIQVKALDTANSIASTSFSIIDSIVRDTATIYMQIATDTATWTTKDSTIGKAPKRDTLSASGLTAGTKYYTRLIYDGRGYADSLNDTLRYGFVITSGVGPDTKKCIITIVR